MKITELKVGQKAKIKKFDFGKKLQLKLIALGLSENSEIIIVKNDNKGALILSCKGNKIILGRGIVEKIDVEKI